MPSKPRKDETEQEYVSRCIAWMTEHNEGKSPEQRAAICYSIYRNQNKKSNNIDKIKENKKVTSYTGSMANKLSDKLIKLAKAINTSKLKERDRVVVDIKLVEKYDKSPNYIKMVKNIIRWSKGKPIVANIEGKFATIATDVKDALLGTTVKVPVKALKKV